MALQSSGAISISDIRNEQVNYGGFSSTYSLHTLSSNAGKGTPDAMSEFYSYSASPTPSCYYYYTTYTGYFDYYDCNGVYRSEYFPYGEGICAQSVVSGGFSNSGTGCLV
jgi:hypothetical protein